MPYYALLCCIDPTRDEEPVYWWRLMLDALRAHGFTLCDSEEGNGYYSVIERDEEYDAEDWWTAIDDYTGDLDNLKAAIQRKPGGVIARFCARSPVRLELSVTVVLLEVKNQVTLMLHLFLSSLRPEPRMATGATEVPSSLADSDHMTALSLAYWFDLIVSLSLACSPATMTMTCPDSGAPADWDENEWREAYPDEFEWELATIALPFTPRIPDLDPSMANIDPTHVLERTLPDGAVLSRVEPFPIPGSDNQPEWVRLSDVMPW
jgi:hypothetical protein